MYTPVNPRFTIQKWGLRGSKLYRHVYVIGTAVHLSRPETFGGLWGSNTASVSMKKYENTFHNMRFSAEIRKHISSFWLKTSFISYYENTPIQIYRNSHLKKLKIFR